MRSPATAALVALVVVAGCGGAKRGHEVKARIAAPSGCHFDVFFSTPIVSGRAATPADIARVRQKLASSSDVRTFAFVSKRLALRRETKRRPVLVQGLHGNPLPPSYEIVPRSPRALSRWRPSFALRAVWSTSARRRPARRV